MQESTIVKVSYPDGTGKVTTLGEVQERFAHMSSGWRRFFFADLEKKGIAYSGFGKYEIQ